MRASLRSTHLGVMSVVPESISREKRLRYRLMKRGYRLVRRRSRSLPSEKRGYAIVEFATGEVVAGGELVVCSLTLEVAEAWESKLGRTSVRAEPVTPELRDE